MHPDPRYRCDADPLVARLLAEGGFGAIYAVTPAGPRVAHTPFLAGADGTLRFHLSRGNALAPHLDDTEALVTLMGPDGYVSPRWYDLRDTVPTWNYVAAELDGRATRMDANALDGFLHDLIAANESRLGGDPWRAEEASAATWDGLLNGIVGFDFRPAAIRPTCKLAQAKPQAVRARIADGLAGAGRHDLARWQAEVAG